MTKSIIAGALGAVSLSMAATAGFTGFTVEQSTNAQGNRVYKVFANFDNVGLGTGQNWVLLNCYNFTTTAGSMNAFHSGAGDLTWVPQGTTTAAHVGNDSWVSATGTHVGSGVALDPGFVEFDWQGEPIPGVDAQIPNGAGWYDASPATANNVTANKIQLMQIVRAGGPGALYSATFAMTYKISGTTAALTGFGNFSIGVADPCAGGADCNQNGCNDARDIATGTSTDINGNGIPDECDPDCNNNDIPDRYEIAQGLVPDCNGDGTPDDCQGAKSIALASPDLGPPSGFDARVAVFSNLLPAESPVTVTVRAVGDLSGTNEYIDPSFNGLPGERIFALGAADCPATPNVAILTLQREQFNDLIAGSGALAIRLACPATVDPTECKAGSLTVELDYTGIEPGGDCNGNERLDVCEIADSTSPDCNSNRKPDSCDIASGFSQDCNTNGVPDSCDVAAGTSQDCNTNGVPDSCDVASGTSPDIDSNLKPDECQTVAVASGGSIQAAINAAPTNEMRIINVAPGTYTGPINLSGKPIRLIGTGGAAVTTISGTAGQSQSVIRAIAGEPAISLIKGFTISGGTTGGPLPSNPVILAGGGVLIASSATSMTDCVLENNGSTFGAGAYLRSHTGAVTNCTFRNNTSQAYSGGLQLFECSTLVSGCSFTGNLAVTAGGAMHIVNGQPRLVQCTFGSNTCYEQGGAISWDPVGSNSLLTLQGCTISGNVASTIGGGLYIYATGVASETQLVGTTVCGNSVRNVSGPYQADAASQICDCRADLNTDGVVNGIDLATIISNINGGDPAADLTGDGIVNGADLSVVLAAWGNCPSN